jgi:hypothetical protein
VAKTSITIAPVKKTKEKHSMSKRENLLRLALVAFGATFILLYPLAIVWPSGWAWHAGAPYESQYFMMIVGVYVTLGAFLINASRNPQAHLSLIWFTVASSVVHALIMAVQSLQMPEHFGHLYGDVPALVIAAFVLAFLIAPAAKTATLSPAR